MKKFFIFSMLILFCSFAHSQDYLPSTDNENIAAWNEDLRQLKKNIKDIVGTFPLSLSNSSEITGILPLANGGIGNPTIPSSSSVMFYNSSTGSIDFAGIGTGLDFSNKILSNSYSYTPGWEYITSGNLSGTQTVDVNISFESGYVYKIIFSGILTNVDGTTDQSIKLRINGATSSILICSREAGVDSYFLIEINIDKNGSFNGFSGGMLSTGNSSQTFGGHLPSIPTTSIGLDANSTSTGTFSGKYFVSRSKQ